MFAQLHGVFEVLPQSPAHHTNGHGCQICGVNAKGLNVKTKYACNQCRSLANKVHGNKYDYSRAEICRSHTQKLLKLFAISTGRSGKSEPVVICLAEDVMIVAE